MIFLKRIFLFLLFSLSAYAENKISPDMIPEELVLAIEKNECAFDSSGRCNPYIIGLNTSQDIRLVKSLGFEITQGRVIECGNINNCTQTLKVLHSNGLKNTDNGPFQINHVHNPMTKLSDYFMFETSKHKVKSILASLINEYGYSWKTVAMYHSKTPSLNEKYRKKLYKNVYNYSPISNIQ